MSRRFFIERNAVPGLTDRQILTLEIRLHRALRSTFPGPGTVEVEVLGPLLRVTGAVENAELAALVEFGAKVEQMLVKQGYAT